MAANDGFADKGDSNADGTEEKWLSAAYSVEKEGNEYKIKKGSNDVVDSGYQEVAVASDSEVLVKDGLVVTDYVDARDFIRTGNSKAKK